jgi:hypothetical protein
MKYIILIVISIVFLSCEKDELLPYDENTKPAINFSNKGLFIKAHKRPAGYGKKGLIDRIETSKENTYIIQHSFRYDSLVDGLAKKEASIILKMRLIGGFTDKDLNFKLRPSANSTAKEGVHFKALSEFVFTSTDTIQVKKTMDQLNEETGESEQVETRVDSIIQRFETEIEIVLLNNELPSDVANEFLELELEVVETDDMTVGAKEMSLCIIRFSNTYFFAPPWWGYFASRSAKAKEYAPYMGKLLFENVIMQESADYYQYLEKNYGTYEISYRNVAYMKGITDLKNLNIEIDKFNTENNE